MTSNILLEIAEQSLVSKALWFTCSSMSQIFERTVKSKEKILYHAWRIFAGKLGELVFANWLLRKNLISLEEYVNFERNALSVFWGRNNVDEFDLHIKGYLIDVKTLSEPFHEYLIVPEDQFRNQPKDIYVCLRLRHNLKSDDLKIQLLKKDCFEIYDILRSGSIKKHYYFEVEILGFIEGDSPFFKLFKEDNICPEKSCYRVHIGKLKNIEELFYFLK